MDEKTKKFEEAATRAATAIQSAAARIIRAAQSTKTDFEAKHIARLSLFLDGIKTRVTEKLTAEFEAKALRSNPAAKNQQANLFEEGNEQ